VINLKKLGIIIIIAIVVALMIIPSKDGTSRGGLFKDRDFVILSNPDNKDVEEDLLTFAKDNKINLTIEYADDLEAVDLLESGSQDYDAVWLSNSVWLYMLNNVKVSDSKSININPVVFGIKKSTANSLGFTDGEVYNKDIVEAIKKGKLNYVMTSVTKTNTGLISYLGFLNALAGSPEILTSDMLKNKKLEEDLKTLFSGVQRVSGSDSFLEDMFLKSDDYNAVVATESALIRINKKLENSHKEPLYLIYPVDGVAVNDSPFAYLDFGQNRKENFLLLQNFLLSLEEQKKLEKLGKRTWYGGVNKSADTSSFKKEWGIDTGVYLNAMKYPSKDVMNDAIIFYIEALRKPASVAFCLDYSGSMYNNGDTELKEAMDFILDAEKAKEEFLQFSEKDKIYVIPFSSNVMNVWSTVNGRNTYDIINKIKALDANGGTNIYGCAQRALELVGADSSDYTKTVILMTDGESNYGTFSELRSTYKRYEGIPIYSIMFGKANERELVDIAGLTNAKVFNGKYNLIGAFKEVRSYN